MERGKRACSANPSSPIDDSQTKRLKSDNDNNDNNSNVGTNTETKKRLSQKQTNNEASEKLPTKRFRYEQLMTAEHNGENEDGSMDMNSSTDSSDSSFSTEPVSDIRSGKILQMNLRNFMCHSNFTIEFNRNVNYLIGNNGSGKSAVITALMLALGASANETSRGANVKQLIKNGENSATIEVIMANDDDHAFEPEVYGDKITFVRHISSNGSSTYKLKGTNGKVVSTKKRDMECIQSFLNLQPCNPIFVLTQEDSRSFIKDSDDEKRHQLFMKATQLETAFKRLYECKHRCNHCETVLSIQTALVAKQKSVINTLQLKYERLQSLEIHASTLKQLKCAACWKHVSEQEKLLEITVTDANEKEAVIRKLQASIGDEMIKEKRERIKQLETKVEQCNAEINKLTAETEQWQIQMKAKTTENDLLTIQIKRSDNKITYLKESLIGLEKKIEDSIQEIDKANALNAEKRKSKLDALKEELDRLVVALCRENEEAPVMKLLKIEAQKEYDNTLRSQAKTQKQIDTIQTELNTFTAEMNDLSVYGVHMPRLLAAVQTHFKMRKFTHLPLGPVARYIKVTDGKWKSPMEYVLKSVLYSFVVSNRNDRLELESLIKTQFPNIGPITVLTRRFDEPLYDISRGTVGKVKDTYRVVDLVTVDNPIIMNVIVDHCRIEKVIFTEKMAVATKISSKIDNVPNNLTRIILINPYSEIFPKPNYRMYGLVNNVAKCIQTNSQEKRAALLAEVERLRKEKKMCDLDEIRQKKELQSLTVGLNAKNKVIDRMTSRRPCLELEIYNITSSAIPLQNQIESLEKELNAVKVDLKFEEDNLEKISAASAQFDIEIKGYVESISVAERNIEAIKEKKKLHLSKINDTNHGIDNAKFTRNFAMDTIKKGQIVITNYKRKMKEIQAAIKQLTEEAIKWGPRIDVCETAEQISENIKRLTILIQSINTDESNLDDVKKELDDRKCELKESMASETVLSSTLKLLTEVRVARAKQFILYRRHMELRFKHNFNRILKLRQYTGFANFQHRKLILTITPNNKDVQVAGATTDGTVTTGGSATTGGATTHLVKSSKCLSGGERSFTTISFLLALWTCCDHAFYFLDEYDVYTDAVNREVINGLLLEESLHNPEHQYVFLTPQDASQITSNEHVTVHCFTEEVPV